MEWSGQERIFDCQKLLVIEMFKKKHWISLV